MSMRITGIRNITFQSNDIKSEAQKANSKTSKAANTVLGLTTAAGLCSAAYFVMRKPANVKRAEDAQKLMNKTLAAVKSDIEQLSEKIVKPMAQGNVSVRYTSKAENSNFLSDNFIFNQDGELYKRIYTYIDEASGDKVIKIYQCKNPKALYAKVSELPEDLLEKTITINRTPMKDFDAYQNGGFEELTYITSSDGKVKTLQKFFNKNKKLHEMTVYNERNSELKEVVRYDYAYNSDGNLAGYAREDITQGKEYVPMSVKMYDGSTVEAKYVDDLYTPDSKFNPDNF